MASFSNTTHCSASTPRSFWRAERAYRTLSCNTGGRMMQSTRTTRGADQRETSQASRFTQNSSHQPTGGSGGSAPQGTPPTRQVSWLRWLIFIIVINLLFYAPLLFSGLGAQQSTINLSYTNFLQQVQHGNVKDVTLTGN